MGKAANAKMAAETAIMTTADALTKAKEAEVDANAQKTLAINKHEDAKKDYDSISSKDIEQKKKAKVTMEFASMELDKATLAAKLATREAKRNKEATAISEGKLATEAAQAAKAAEIASGACRVAQEQAKSAQADAEKLTAMSKAVEERMKAQDAEEKKRKEERLKSRSYALKLEGGAFGDFGHAGFLQVQEKPENGLTVEAWVKLRAKSDNPDKYVGIVSALGGPVGSEDSKGWFLGVDDKTFVWAARSTGEESMTFVKGEKAVDLNRWYHIAGTFNRTQVRLYVNGKLFAWKHLSSGKPMYGGKSPEDGAAFMIGSVPGPAAAFSDISVDDIALWDHALAKEELMKHAVMRKETRESLTNPKLNKDNGLIALYNFGPGEVPGTDIIDESKVNKINGKVAVVDGAS